MPLQSKRTVKVHGIPTGTTKQQYLDFVEHLCTKPRKTSKFHFPRIAKHFKGKSKLRVDASTSASTDEGDEDARSKDESELTPPPSTLKGKGEQAAPLLNNTHATAQGWKEITFYVQNRQSVGTISFDNEALKNEALARHQKDKKSRWKDWTTEDNFIGITTLYEAADAKVDICAVHGLGGNAIDTWTAKNGKMWFRDFLPEHENFKNSRVMTFGYNSDLTDRSTVLELENWAETLLRCLNEVRTGDKEKLRPILLVCHSLGGLVVRKAMAQLHLISNCKNITLSQCGIVFLATPHSGSTKADWSNFLVATARTIGGVRPETVKTLQSFNTASVWDTAAFLNLEPHPPFRCFAEGSKMWVKGIYQHIVTQASATLGKHQAYMIMEVDHSSICKFETTLGAYVTIAMALQELLCEVTTGGPLQPNAQQQRRMFGQPRFLAQAYPPDQGFWWEGTELNEIQHHLTSTRPFFGRSEDLKKLESSAKVLTRPRLTAIKGIAGIGKTELLLQFAAKQKGLRNVFFLASQDKETIDSVISKISTRIGFDMIDDPVKNQDRWRSTPVSERIQIFITWLGNVCNKDSLFIIDDIEAFGYSQIPMILKYPAHHVLLSTRDSNLRSADRDFQEIRLAPLGHYDTVRVLQSTLKNLSAEPSYWKGLDSMAQSIQGHPLAAKNAIAFMIDYLATYDMPSSTFTHLFESQDPEDRKTFLEFSFEGRSLWDAFHTSLERLELQPNHQSATKLLQILPFLSSSNGLLDDFLKMDKSWLRDCENEFPDIVILKSGYIAVSGWLSKLRGVSLYLYNDSSRSSRDLNIHPLISQYMLLHIEERRRIILLKQVLCLFHKLEGRGAKRHSHISPHVQHCIQVYRGLGLSLETLDLPEAVTKWVEGFLWEEKVEELEDEGELGEDPFTDPVELPEKLVDDFVTLCVRMKETMQRHENAMAEGSTAYQMIMECKTAYREVRRRTELHERVPGSRKDNLIDAVTMFQDMVQTRSNYPEFRCELEDFKRSLEAD